MTKKDYKAIAEMLRTTLNAYPERSDETIGQFFTRIVNDLMAVFEADNSRFDRAKFFDAVYKD